MHVAIIGAGNVGRALGTKLAAAGHTVMFGVPDATHGKYNALRSLTNVTIGSPRDAAAAADIIVLATPWPATKAAIDDCGPLSGKILIDCTNPIRVDFSGLDTGADTSGAEMIAGWASGARVVKCFNQTGADNMANPIYGDRASVIFAAGDDAGAVETATQLARDIGFDAVALSGLRMARELEHLAWLWISMALKQGMGRNFAFALLRR